MTALEAEGVTATLGGFHLGPVDLMANPGEAIAVIGPSGAGKTTLLRCLAGFLPLDRGRIAIDGSDCQDRPPEERGLGYVPQGYALLPHRNVLQNVGYPAEIRGEPDAEERAERLLRRFRLEGLARSLPSQLSGGEKQRVAMARALAASPRLLLWDEPLAALDALAQDELLDLLRGVLESDRVPLVLVTHDAGTAFSVAERCLVLEQGCASFFGPLEDLLTRPPTAFVARFLGMENVYRRKDLEASPSSFARWLVDHGGSTGACLPADRLTWSTEGGAGWKASAHRIRRTPRGTELWADVDGVPVRAVRPGGSDAGRGPRAGEDLWIRVDEASVIPIQGGEDGRSDPSA